MQLWASRLSYNLRKFGSLRSNSSYLNHCVAEGTGAASRSPTPAQCSKFGHKLLFTVLGVAALTKHSTFLRSLGQTLAKPSGRCQRTATQLLLSVTLLRLRIT